jgi:hypothetical protein
VRYVGGKGEGDVQQMKTFLYNTVVYAGHNEPTVTAVSIEMSGVL